MGFLQRITQFDAHHRLIWSVGAAVVAYLVMEGRVDQPLQIDCAWIVFAFVDLLFIWLMFVHEDPGTVRRTIKLQDSSRTFLFFLVVIACAVSLAAVGLILSPSKNLPTGKKTLYSLLTFATVGFSWFLVHSVFAIRYAHMYYRSGMSKHAEEKIGGLEFPSEPRPDYRDFAYYSFVVGMTCQVSDVQVTERKLRRLTLTHGVLSFAFNTIILALSINIIAGFI